MSTEVTSRNSVPILLNTEQGTQRVGRKVEAIYLPSAYERRQHRVQT